MNWGELIKSIMAVLGPVLAELLKKWLDGKLKTAARTMPTADGTVRADGATWLLEAVLAATPRRQTFRRALLRQAIVSVPGALTAGKLNSADRKELAALAAAAAEE